jgi:N-acetylmuramoyl-L-alanine amidase
MKPRHFAAFSLAVLLLVSSTGDYVSAAIDRSFYDSNKILYYDPTACDPSSGEGSGTLTGNTDAEQIWNYLVSNGLSEKQAAGIMGNMHAESGFVPTRRQTTGALDANSGYNNAFGLVQWDGGRRYTAPDRGIVGALKKEKPALAKYLDAQYDYGRDPSAKSKIPAADHDALMLFELDYMKQESQSRATTAKGFGNAGKEWDTLKKQTTIEDATVFWHNNFEVSADTASMIANRVQFAKDAYASFAGKAAASTPNTSSVDGSKASKPVVFLDPGHGGAIPEYTDEKTGLVTSESHNMPEGADVLDVANRVKGELEKAGYTVILSRTTNDQKVTFRERANAAAKAKASIGVSIHTSPGGPNDAWPQHNGFREYGSKKDTFGDDATETATIKTSQKYAGIVAKARTDAEGHTVGNDPDSKHQEQSFGRGKDKGIASPGNIPFVALWSPTVPWVYNEIAQDDGTGISEKTKAAYAKGLVAGIKEALPVAIGTDTCGGSDFAGGDFEKTLLAYAWPNYHKPNYLDKMPAYAKAVTAATKAGRYVGGGVNPGIDCGGFVTTLMIDSGFEPNYNYGSKLSAGAGPTGNQEAWMKANWQSIGNSNGKNAADLKQGDVAINGEHTYVYVGKVAGFDSITASASYSPHNTAWRAPMAGPELPNTPGFRWYRKK